MAATVLTAEPVPHGRARTARRLVIGWLGSALLLVALAFVSIMVGSQAIPFDAIVHALLHGGHSDDALIVTGLRIPRTALGLLVGASLGVAGALMQAFTRNPLADPGILGVNAGAALAVVIGIAFLGMSGVGQYLWLAFGGAIITTVVVYTIGVSGRGGGTSVRMTLAGVGIAAVLAGITEILTLSNPDTFTSALNWSAGALAGVPLSASAAIAPFVVIGLVLAALTAREMNALALGDELATSLGARAASARVAAVVAVTLLAGAATAAAGPIAFVGLMIPRLARWITGPHQGWILAYSLTLGPCLILASDTLGRIAVEPSELPVGVVTAFVGAPVLIMLARRVKASSL